jgi:hypothetical protein
MGVKLGLTLREELRLRVSENRMLRRIFGSKRENTVRDWRELCNDEFHNLHSSPNTIRVIKSRRMRWAEHTAYIGEMKKYINFARKLYRN